MALYGVSILFVALVVAASLANWHFGTNFSTILLRESPGPDASTCSLSASTVGLLPAACVESEPSSDCYAPCLLQ
jgi:hypothetical protein